MYKTQDPVLSAQDLTLFSLLFSDTPGVNDAEPQTTRLAGTERNGVSIALAVQRGEQPLGWIAAANAAALPGLARKLPHDGKHGWLTFTDSAPDNQDKGQWPAADSDLVQWFGNALPAVERPPRAALVNE